MKSPGKYIVPIAAFAAVFALSACNKEAAPPPPPPAAVAPPPAATPAPAPAAPAAQATTVTAINLGNSLDPGGKVVVNTGPFAPKDTIYAEVTTNSSGAAGTTALGATWTYGDGQPVSQSSESVSTATGTATTTFHVSKPDGWPAGKYKVEISVDGKPASSAMFEVK